MSASSPSTKYYRSRSSKNQAMEADSQVERWEEPHRVSRVRWPNWTRSRVALKHISDRTRRRRDGSCGTIGFNGLCRVRPFLGAEGQSEKRQPSCIEGVIDRLVQLAVDADLPQMRAIAKFSMERKQDKL